MSEEIIKAYKGFDKDLKCRDFQYEIGKEYTHDGPVKACESGFHACEAPLDVLRYYGIKDGNRFCEVEQSGALSSDDDDTKVASSKIKIEAEIGLPGLVKAHFEYTKEKAEVGQKAGEKGCLAGGDRSNLAGGDSSNLAGGYRSNLAGGYRSNLAGGDSSNLAGGDSSNLAGGDSSNLAGGYRSNLAGGYRSNLAGGNSSNLAGGYRSNLAGGDGSLCVVRNGKAKGGINSVLCLTSWEWAGDEYVPTFVKSFIIDGETYKPDTWYTLKDGEIVEAPDE